MTPIENFGQKMRLFWAKQQVNLFALVLSIYALPVSFYYYIFKDLDGSWNRSLNMAIKNNLVFGKDLVFTFGPLAYLSTRNTEYVRDIYLLLFDFFVSVCFFMLFRRMLQKSTKYFPVLLLSLLYFKGCEGSMILFILFSAYSCLCLEDGFSNYLDVAIIAISGVLVFFMKINFGLITIPLMGMLLIYLLVKNFRAGIIFSTISILLFVAIYLKTEINLLGYVRYGSLLIAHYGETMQIAMEPTQRNFLWALALCTVYLYLICYYLWNAIRRRTFSIEKMAVCGLSMLNVFLTYKNSFTRNDSHNDTFFGFLPFFVTLTMYILYKEFNWRSTVLYVIVFLMVDANLKLPHGDEGRFFSYNAFIAPTINYVDHMFVKQKDVIDTTLVIPDAARKQIGEGTIDILPVDVALLQQNNMNYHPRPVMQSYAAYCHELDSLNADHFYNKNRPQWVMSWTWTIDNRYAGWEEPLTNAMLRMNYDYSGFITTRTVGSMDEHGYYLLLKAKSIPVKLPEFEKVYSVEASLADTVRFSFPNDTPYYMSANINYSTLGKINNLLYQPATLNFTFFFADTLKPYTESRKVLKPIIDHPVLVNKLILANSHFINFMTGYLGNNRTINAFCIQTKERDFEEKVTYTFYRLKNYF
ncbi:MAG: hypothetical protein KF744_01730 [Taibaiella sp.]|nr:hypothetical protein [Taibaiella sp.]